MEPYLYEGAVKTASLTGPIDICTLINGVGDIEIREITVATVSCGAASSPEFGLGRPGTDGVGFSGTFLRSGDNIGSPSSQTQMCLTSNWSTSNPTAPSVLLRRYAPVVGSTAQGTLQGGIAWTWDADEFVLHDDEQLTVWLLAGTSTVFTVSIRVRGT